MCHHGLYMYYILKYMEVYITVYVDQIGWHFYFFMALCGKGQLYISMSYFYVISIAIFVAVVS